MCVVVDTCVIARFFTQGDRDYEPVRHWVLTGRGKMVMGGTTYRNELTKMRRYLGIVTELARQGRVVALDETEVDEIERWVRDRKPDPDFDDPHIIAIVDLSGCRIVCTADSRSDRFIRDSGLYQRSRRPSIYRSRSHAHMVRDSNIVGRCGC